MILKILFIITQNFKPPKCPLTDGWLNIFYTIHIMKYFLKIEEQNIDANKNMSDSPENYAK